MKNLKSLLKHITKIPYVGFALCAFILAMCFHYALPTIKARQTFYNSVNNSNELLEEYYSTCSTDTECEQLESKLNFDFKKGMN